MRHSLVLIAFLVSFVSPLCAIPVVGSWYNDKALQKVQSYRGGLESYEIDNLEGFSVWRNSKGLLCYESRLGMYGIVYAENVQIVSLSDTIFEIRYKSKDKGKNITLLRFVLLSADTGYIENLGGPTLPEIRNWIFRKVAPDPFPALWQSNGKGTGLSPLQ